MVFEFIISPFFWLLLYNPEDHYTIATIGEMTDHSLPLSCLLIEYLFLSNPPFLLRQFPLIFMIAVMYLGINCAITLIFSPVYPVMSWTGVMGFVVPLATILAAIGIFMILQFISKKRLRRNGNGLLVDIIEGRTKLV